MKNFREHAKAIRLELENAKKKHPDFCTELSRYPLLTWLAREQEFKSRNDKAEAKKHLPHRAEDILNEEIAESFAAALAGEKANAIHEFYQVCAVCIRCIEYLENN